jgi:hypothetical protein
VIPVDGERAFPGVWADLAQALAEAEALLGGALAAGLPASQAQVVRRRIASAIVVARHDAVAASARLRELIDELET